MEELLRAAMGTVKVPTNRDRVYKDECMFSFDTPESLGGLYTSLTTWHSFAADYLDLDFDRRANPLYLKQVWKRVIREEDSAADTNQADALPSKLAIGLEGGFDVDKKNYDIHVSNYLVVMPQRVELLLPSDIVPTMVQLAVDAILKHDGFMRVSQVASAWEEEDRKESKYAKNLIQLDTGKKVSPDPKKWKCGESGLTENLWLNLSTGYIGSGRKGWDGSGGTGAALTHFQNTGSKYPLAVKLGTITPHGADVFSYAPDENDMVLDPYLASHLAHWGINMMQQEKTEKTMTELEVDLNSSYHFDKITESGSELEPLHGPGYIGLENLGNSCYMASIMQILFSIPELEGRYKEKALDIFKSSAEDPAEDLLVMVAKLGVGLLSDRYSKPTIMYERDSTGSGKLVPSSSKPTDGHGSVRPFMFKNLIGKGHFEFSSGRQQDSSEFFQFFLEKITRAEGAGLSRLLGDEASEDTFVSTQALFGFKVEERFEDSSSKKVKYVTRSENMLSLTIDVDAAVNKAQYEEFEEQKRKKLKTDTDERMETSPVQLQVPLSACLRAYALPEFIEEFTSPETGIKGTALKQTRFRTFPQYLVIHLKRYYMAEDWTPKKLDAAVLMPGQLDLSELKSTGPVDSEVLFSEEVTQSAETASAPLKVAPNPEIVSQLMAMGFSENGSKRAAIATNNSGSEASMEWVFAHMEDPDFNEPIAVSADVPGNVASRSTDGFSEEDISNLTAMGFTSIQAKAALKSTGGSLERAVDWLFNHTGDLDATIAVAEKGAEGPSGDSNAPDFQDGFIDGEPRYELLGFASHLGSNTGCGHYVAHIKKEGRFVLYNDAKVAISQNPPIDLGFVYVYRRQ